VPRALRGDPQAVLAGEAHDGDDVLDGLRHRDRGRPLVDRQVPRLAGDVPALVAGQDERAGELGAQQSGIQPQCVSDQHQAPLGVR
jgi:hypothetical protein